ncbi:MAG: Crp/Fnr family transcriptional regulator [Chloroflexi bacterium]|nr:MAG: Crp/Fnr family transcriptional regulator [Chloroflexota bacterium]
MDPIPILLRTALFGGLPADQLDPLLPAIRSRSYARGSYLFHEGDAGTTFYVINTGQVKIARLGRQGEEAVFAILLPGDTFGELALFEDNATRTADAQAMDLTECLTLERQAFVTFIDRHPELTRHVIRLLSGYIRGMDESFSEAAFLDIPGRVAKKLLELSETHGKPAAVGNRITMRLTQRTLAGMVAASRENVNRALSRLSARGDILQEGGYITILRPSELRKRA